MILAGLFLMSANDKLVVLFGILLFIAGAYREGAFYTMARTLKRKRKESCHRPK
jgi:hypothetical protein